MCLTCDMLNLLFLQPDSSAAAFGPGDVGPAKQQSTAEETKGSTDHKCFFQTRQILTAGNIYIWLLQRIY